MGGIRSCRALFASPLFLLPSVVSTTAHFPSIHPTISRPRFRMASTGFSHAGASGGAAGKESPPTTSEYATAAPESHAAASSSSSSSSAIDFLSLCHRLKTTKRTGWVRRQVQDPESIADHMYRMGVMALISADIPGVDRDRCMKMAIVHDIAEAIVGDITPSDGVPKEEKSRREREALDYMCKVLGGSRAKEISELWMEYEENSSREAKIVKDFDKVEMILQAFEYENEQGKDLEEFFESTAGKFQTDVGKAWAAEIIARRKRRGA